MFKTFLCPQSCNRFIFRTTILLSLYFFYPLKYSLNLMSVYFPLSLSTDVYSPKCREFHTNLLLVFLEFACFHCGGETNWNIDMQVSMAIPLPNFRGYPKFKRIYITKGIVQTINPRPITVNGDIYIFTSSLFMSNQL